MGPLAGASVRVTFRLRMKPSPILSTAALTRADCRVWIHRPPTSPQPLHLRFPYPLPLILPGRSKVTVPLCVPTVHSNFPARWRLNSAGHRADAAGLFAGLLRGSLLQSEADTSSIISDISAAVAIRLTESLHQSGLVGQSGIAKFCQQAVSD